MKMKEMFKNVFSYAAGMETWVKGNLPYKLEYTFANDFAVADWVEGEKGVKETYQNVKKSWLNNYKAFTEVVVSINMLAWAHNQLQKQGIEGREPFIKLYSELYHVASNDFYEKYEGNTEACQHFFEMTD